MVETRLRPATASSNTFSGPKREYARWLALGLCVALWCGPSPVGASDLETYLDEVRSEYGLPALAAAVVKGGEVTDAAATGTRVAHGDIPVTIDDRFHLGSNTKSMTATLAGALVEEGKLRWDSTVGEVLGEDIDGLSDSLSKATLAQLLSHSSGVPGDTDEMMDLYFNVDVFDYNLPELRRHTLESWAANEVSIPDGSPFQYANFGYMIAGMMMEKAAGTPWEAMVHERIFDPLDMETAGLGPQATFGLIDAPVGHRVDADGNVTPMFWGPAADVPPVIGPAGNAHMSVLDYAKWAAWNAGKASRGPALLEPETLATIQAEHVRTPARENPPPGTPSTGGYGLGWGVVEFDWADHPILTHNGSNSMNLARIVVDTDRDLAVVVLTNFPGAGANEAAGKVMEHLYTSNLE